MSCLIKTNQSPLKFLLNQFLIIQRGFFPTQKIIRKIEKHSRVTLVKIPSFGRFSAHLGHTNDLPTL